MIISFSNFGNRIPKEQVKWEIQKDRIQRRGKIEKTETETTKRKYSKEEKGTTTVLFFICEAFNNDGITPHSCDEMNKM